MQIVRWEGPLGKFTFLATKRGIEYGLKSGDTLKASIVGNMITVYVNGVEKARINDEVVTRRGIQALACFCNAMAVTVGSNKDFGFTSFSAQELERPTSQTRNRTGIAGPLVTTQTRQESRCSFIVAYSLGVSSICVWLPDSRLVP